MLPMPMVYPVGQCRDPKDNKFLETTLNGKADPILTGDSDLLALHPWQGIAILSSARYLKRGEGLRAARFAMPRTPRYYRSCDGARNQSRFYEWSPGALDPQATPAGGDVWL
jgi:hypothetical protein